MVGGSLVGKQHNHLSYLMLRTSRQVLTKMSSSSMFKVQVQRHLWMRTTLSSHVVPQLVFPSEPHCFDQSRLHAKTSASLLMSCLHLASFFSPPFLSSSQSSVGIQWILLNLKKMCRWEEKLEDKKKKVTFYINFNETMIVWSIYTVFVPWIRELEWTAFR